MKYIYARVSTGSQNVKQQAEYLAMKYAYDEIITEQFSGETTERPEFTRLLGRLKSGDTLIVYHVSRLGRKTAEVMTTVEFLKDNNIAVYVDQLQGIDITSGVGKLLFTMLSGLAELEKEQMLERQRIGINRAKKEGKYQGRKPIDEDIIVSAKVLIASGMPKTKIAKQLGKVV